MSRRARLAAAALLLLMVPLPGLARTRRKPKPKLPGPESVVWRFCQLDLQGARLSERASGSLELQSLMVAPTRRDGDRAVITAGCNIGAISRAAATARVTLTYTNLGTLTEQGEILPPARRSEIVKFQLKKVGNDWRIGGPALSPHVSAQALSAFWQHRADLAEDQAAKRNAEEVIDRLRRLEEQIAAPASDPLSVSTRKSETP